MKDKNLELVNCVGAGKVPVEIDIQELSKDLPSQTASLTNGGIFFKLNKNSPTIRVSRSGNYYISGASSEKELTKTKSEVLELFSELGMIDAPIDSSFSIINMVYTCDMRESIDLNALAIFLGLENIEYEPEQFPGLIYRPDESSYVVLVFNSGKLTITGGNSRTGAKKTTRHMCDVLSSYT
jgi:transcription initiation factor TFIID TATA-box-binding protein